ncbi:hypothetical protein [Paenibacillus sp. y28]|uniref:hypothetical protein n=1 Tax=Paenibacillus sp. y28 TaxID=3129110 RepID=UPI00301ABB37
MAGGRLLAWAMMNDALHPGNGRHYSNRVAVLEYHHLDPAASDYTITPEMLQAHLIALQASHYQMISMQQFLELDKLQDEATGAGKLKIRLKDAIPHYRKM